MNSFNTALRWAALAAFALTTAQAASFDLSYTGTFGSETTLGGVALTAATPFSITATFQDAVSGSAYDFNLFEVKALSLTLTGYGTYTAIPDPNLNVIMLTQNGNYYIGLGDQNVSLTFFKKFTGSSNSSFDYNSPTATTFSGFGSDNGNRPYNISLVGVTGGLSIGYSPSITSATASITAVPEPAEYAAVTGLALGVFALVQRRRQATGR